MPQAACSHRPPCPGCPRFGEAGVAPAARARVARLAESAGLGPPPVHAAPADGHRHRARLAVRGRARSPKLGLFQAGSHRIVDIPRCGIHHPAINRAVSALKEAIRETGTPPYADRPHRGALRYVQLAVERASQRVQIVLVGNATTPGVLGELPTAVAARMGDALQGLFFNGQPERSNTILGPHWHSLVGEPALVEALGGARVHFPPGAFGQSHLPLFARLVERVQSLVPDGATLAELYAGVGALSLGLLPRLARLHWNERSSDGQAGFERGLRERTHPEQERARAYPGAAGDRLDALEGADVVLVDPPRRGLDPALLQRLAAAPPERLVYVSCGLDALERELALLRAAGGLRLAGIEAWALFPYTEHVETLAWLDRAPAPRPAAGGAPSGARPSP